MSSGRIREQIVVGGIWMVALRIAVRLLGLVSVAVVARLLTPADFGLVGLASALAAGIALLGNFGFDNYLIQKKTLRDEHYSAVWSLNILRCALIAALLLTVAPALAAFYSEPRLEEVLWILALLTMLEGFENPGIVDFRKKMRFHQEFWLQLIPNALRVIATIAAAFGLGSYIALLMGIAVRRLCQLLLSYVMHPFRPHWRLREAREILGFSRWILLTGGLRFLIERSPMLWLGRVTDLATVGFYENARELAQMAITEFIYPLSRALFPGLAKIAAEEPAAVAATVRDAFAIFLAVSLPVALGLVLTADLVIPLLLGSQWLGAIPYLELLAWSGAVMGGYGAAGNVLVALGRPALATLSNALQLAVLQRCLPPIGAA